jgi:AcrR family transcriptional regulator
MQDASGRRSNKERREATLTALTSAARRLFVEKGYAETSTPEIVSAAGLSRGALYHHFADKQALFRAVVEQESAQVAEEIERATPSDLDPVEALLAGSRAYLQAMRAPGRTRLLLLDAPAVLGRAAMDETDSRHGNRTLREGLAAATRAGAIRKFPLDALTSLLGAMFDRAALAVEEGDAWEDHLSVMSALIGGLKR